MPSQIIKLVVIAIICYTAICLWNRIFDPSANCDPLTFITSLISQVLCILVNLLIYIITFVFQLLAALFGVTLTLTPPSLNC